MQICSVPTVCMWLAVSTAASLLAVSSRLKSDGCSHTILDASLLLCLACLMVLVATSQRLGFEGCLDGGLSCRRLRCDHSLQE
eukprot:5034046-Amphidinium_carterae.1